MSRAMSSSALHEVVDDGCRQLTAARDVRAKIGAHLGAELVDRGIRPVHLLATRGARVVAGRRLVRGGALVARGRGQVGAQALHGLAHAAAHLVRDQAHRIGQTSLDALEVARAGGDLGATGIRDLVDGLAAVDGLGDQSLFLELGEAGIDRAGARRVGAAGAVRRAPA